RAGLWSHLLALGFIRDPFAVEDLEAFNAWLGRRVEQWNEATKLGDDAPYYVRAANERGSHSTFLAVQVGDDHWSAIAVGDTCLLQIREGELIGSFPINDPEHFDFTPNLISTVSAPSDVRQAKGAFRAGDVLLGITDAGAEWLLRARSDNADVIRRLASASLSSLDRLVREERHSGALRNDDVAVVRCLGSNSLDRVA
ncbi:MAG: hypothetical protein V3V01_20885, partial [Acidimicrobiales bacterium]